MPDYDLREIISELVKAALVYEDWRGVPWSCALCQGTGETKETIGHIQCWVPYAVEALGGYPRKDWEREHDG